MILDAVRIQRSSRAAVRVAVALADDKVISREEALMRVEPKALSELLHRQVAPNALRKIMSKGIPASPGAATGKIVFTASDAQACAARDEAAVLVRRETGPGRYSGDACSRCGCNGAGRCDQPCSCDWPRSWPSLCCWSFGYVN